MPFVPGIKRLSGLVIDISKDWASRRILNLGVPTTEGDALRKGTRLSMAEMPDGPKGHVFLGQGAGLNSAFSPGLTTNVGDVLMASADTLRSTTSLTWVKVKEIKLKASGNLRIRFDLRVRRVPYTARGQIWRNGASLGVVRSTTRTTFTTFTEDLTGLLQGDLIQLYIRGNGETVEAKNFRLYIETMVGGEVLLD